MDKRIEKTYDILLRAFFKLLRTETYEDITVLDICKEADIQRPTFYNNFKDKKDFVFKILKWEFDEIIKRDRIPTEDIYFEDFVILVLKGYIKDLDYNRKDPVFLRSEFAISSLFKIVWEVEAEYFKEKYPILPHKHDKGNVDIDILMYEYSGFFCLQAHYFYYHRDISFFKMCEIIDIVKTQSLF